MRLDIRPRDTVLPFALTSLCQNQILSSSRNLENLVNLAISMFQLGEMYIVDSDVDVREMRHCLEENTYRELQTLII